MLSKEVLTVSKIAALGASMSNYLHTDDSAVSIAEAGINCKDMQQWPDADPIH